MSPMDQLGRDLTWVPLYIVAALCAGWRGAALIFLVHWLCNIRRAA